MKNVFKTASAVTGLSIAERALGFLYRVVLARLIGAQGLGIYQIALSVFGVFATLGTGGIPVSVSRLISKSKAENDLLGERAAVSSGVFLSLLFTLPTVLIFLCSGNVFSFLFSGEKALSVFKILLLGLVFSCLYAVLRGWFWGQKKFLTTSVLEIAEESVMVVIGIFLIKRANSSFTGAKFAALAAVISYLFSFSAALCCFLFQKGKFLSPFKTFRPLASSALPITAVRAGGSLVNSAVAVLLPAMLIRAGMQASEATELFGILSGMVIPVLFVPSTVLGSLSLVLVPELSEDFYAKRYKRLTKNVERGLFAATLVACFLLPVIASLGKDIGLLAFSSKTAGEMIEKSCPILLPMSLAMITTSILNSIGYEKQTFAYFFAGAAAMLACILFLTPYVHGYSYVLGLASSYVVCAALNLRKLFKTIPFKNFSPAFFKRTTTAIALVFPLSLFGKLLSAPLSTIFGALLSKILLALALTVVTLIFYLLCGILPIKRKQKRSLAKI